ncbi:flagellar basal body P-ring formation chaperone FlgA [Paraherbaspirillum soli]|uniref:Flagellar basal body P-ring formation chaperone FlgA n=1 Tax=Paraherbaspirillum soli TaxID=631222 RepID=A0ABW0MCT0_9BURK
MHASANRRSLSATTLPGALAKIAITIAALTTTASHAASPRPAPLGGSAQPVIEQFLLHQSAGLPGKVSISIDTPISGPLPACDAPEVFLPNGARLWGRVSVGVRCNGTQTGAEKSPAWSRYVPAYVAVVGSYYVATRPIAAGETLGAADFTVRDGDLTTLPRSIITNPAQANGMIAVNRIASGAPLRLEQLHGATVVQRGQNVKLVTQGAGFVASTEGQAVNNAIAGAAVQVKTQGGQVVSGTARPDGSVELSN